MGGRYVSHVWTRMKRLPWIFLMTLFPPAAVLAPPVLAQPAPAQPPVMLPGRVHPLANARNDRGAVESSFALPGMTLLLKSSAAQQADLEQLAAAQQDPSSPGFHRWLTPEQYADRFGASAADVAQVTAWLKSQGFTVTNTARSRTFISFRGTAGQAESAFHTEIHRYSVNGEMHFANATSPSIPASLAGVVAGIAGLHDFHPKPRLRRPPPELTSAGGIHHLAPDDIATIYDIAPLYAANVDGTGQSIVVVGQSDVVLSDIQAFRREFNLTAPRLNQVRVPGRPDPGISPGDVDESSLDIEWSGAVARNATIVFVYSDDVWESTRYAVDQNLAPVLTMSYGACEQSDLVDLAGYRALARQANTQGMTWLAASGDSGAADCEDQDATVAENGLAVDVPGSIPEVTAMGGTEFNEQNGSGYWSSSNTANSASARAYIPEMAWNDTGFNGSLAATGGGASTYFAQPGWQTGAGVPQDGWRHVPDLAFSASASHDSYAFYSTSGASYVGGTSVAAPLMAGVLALVNQYLAAPQPGLGNVNPMLYRLAQGAPGVFHDVTVGDNQVPCAAGTPNCTNGVVGYMAATGYDLATGLGSVDVANLVHQWSSQPPPGSSVVPSLDQNPVFEQAPDSQGNRWSVKITLAEEAGVGTTLTDFSIDGVSYASEIAALFGTPAIAARGSITAAYGFAALAVPKTVTLGFAGVDAGGRQWSTALAAPFSGPQTQLTVAGISNAATGVAAFAPGMLVSVYGTALGDFAQSAAAIPLPQYLAGFEAMVNNVPAPLYYVSPNQVNVQIPYETAPGAATLMLGNPYQNVNYNFHVQAAAPGIFTLPDGSVNPSSTARVGDTVTMFITGEGPVRPSLATGATPSPRTPVSQLPQPRLPVMVTVGNAAATVQFIGIPSGLVGVTQINFTIPTGVSAGPQPVVVTVGAAASPPAKITIAQ